MVSIVLDPQEIAVLDRQPASTKANGGWQNLMVTLQQKLDRATGRLTLTIRDIERIRRYAFNYGNGGWENRLRAIFQRTLGPSLGGQQLRPKAA
jgi:hypothetical protein